MSRLSFKHCLAVCGAAALIMATALPAAAGGGDTAIAEGVHRALGRFDDVISVKIDQGRVYLKGSFGTPDERAQAVERVSRVNGVTGVYDYTEDLSGPNS